MKPVLLFLFFTFMTLGTIFGQMPPLETGVSQDLAKWRSANYSDIKYKLDITLGKGAPLMRGDIEVSVTLTDEGAKNDLVLDWRTTQFQNDKDKPFAEVEKVNEKIVKETVQNGVFDYAIDKEHIIISKKYLKTGVNTIEINFASPIKTSGAAITRYIDKEDGAEYIYSLFVPSDASTAFPVFDQPDLKAQFYLRMYVPEGWKVVSNNRLQAYAGVLNEANEPTGKVAYFFLQTKPISTYIFAFAAGEFAEFAQRDTGETVNLNEIKAKTAKDKSIVSDQDYWRKIGNIVSDSIYVRKSQAEKFKVHEKEVFRLNREGVKFLEDYFNYKFPFPKYDLVLIPEFPFGGMEHAGATFLRESSVIFPTEPTKNDYVSRANLIFHEAAHQWFGDTVTMKWFDDLWLKEGFAEFMAYKTLEKVMPEYNAWKIFYERNKQAAYLTDSTRGTTPIYQEIKNLSAAKSAYGNIVYRKAPSFLKQAEFYLGGDKFQIAVRQFLKKHEFANAEWADLIKEFETAIETGEQTSFGKKENLKEWADYWVKQRGLPIVKITRTQPENGKSFSINVQAENSLEKNIEPRMLFFMYSKESYRESKSTFGWELPSRVPKGFTRVFNSEPYLIFPNYQDYGYGIFLLDEKSRAYVLANIQNEKDDFLRAMMWGSLWDSVRETELAPKDYVELVIKNISVESDESTIQTLLGRVSIAANYYLNDAQRDELAPQVEKLLIEKFQTAPTVGQKITYFRALQSIGSGDETRKIFKDLLNNKSNLKDVSLKTKDKFDLLTRLLILDDKDAPAILARLEKTETSDEAKRYAYAAKAGIKTAENKAKFFNDFVNNKEISESWIEAAFVPFNSIRHSELTLPFLDKALAELPALKKNRKIFFINGWLASFIGGQKSEEALKIVTEFLEKNPNLDRDLRLKILENADNLERAVKIRAKYGK